MSNAKWVIPTPEDPARENESALRADAFEVPATPWPLACVLVRSAHHTAAFVNRCPHAGHALDFPKGRFLSSDGAHLQCRSHGALFDPHSGECVSGPCVGERLVALPIERVDGTLQIDLPAVLRTN